MANRLPFIAVIAAVILFLIYSSVFVVNAGQQAIVLRFGEIVDVKTEPGIYFKAPFAFFEADNVQIIENRILRFDLDDIRVQVSGGKFYEVDAFVAYRISDARTFRQAVSGSVEPGGSAAAHPPRRGVAPRLWRARLRIGALRRARGDDARSARPASAGRHVARAGDRGRPHPPHRPDAGGLAADLRPHEGRATGRGRKAARPRPRGGAAHPRPRRPRGGRDRRRGAQGIGNPARRGRSPAQRDIRRRLPARSGLLRVLPLDDRLLERAARHRHDHGAVARLGVLPLLQQPERRQAAPAGPATPPAAPQAGATGAIPEPGAAAAETTSASP